MRLPRRARPRQALGVQLERGRPIAAKLGAVGVDRGQLPHGISGRQHVGLLEHRLGPRDVLFVGERVGEKHEAPQDQPAVTGPSEDGERLPLQLDRLVVALIPHEHPAGGTHRERALELVADRAPLLKRLAHEPDSLGPTLKLDAFRQHGEDPRAVGCRSRPALARAAKLFGDLGQHPGVDPVGREVGADPDVQLGVPRPGPGHRGPKLLGDRQQAAVVVGRRAPLPQPGSVSSIGHVTSVKLPDAVRFAARGQLLQRVVSQRLRNPEPGAEVGVLPAAHERELDQRLEAIKRLRGRRLWARHRLEQRQRGGAHAHRQPREQRSLGRLEQRVGPFDRRAQAALALGRVALTPREQVERPLESLLQLERTQHLDPRGRQLDRKRRVVEPLADPLDCGGLVGPRGERRIDRRGALEEQPLRILRSQRAERDGALRGDPQENLAGHEHAKLAVLRQQFGEHRGAFEQLLEVVEHEQGGLRGEAPTENLEQRPLRLPGHADLLGDHRKNRRRIRDPR